MQPNNTMPINIGWYYKLYPETSTNWVEVIDIADGYVYVRGVEDTIAAWHVPTWKFDDLIAEYMERGAFLETEDELFLIAAEDGSELLGV